MADAVLGRIGGEDGFGRWERGWQYDHALPRPRRSAQLAVPATGSAGAVLQRARLLCACLESAQGAHRQYGYADRAWIVSSLLLQCRAHGVQFERARVL